MGGTDVLQMYDDDIPVPPLKEQESAAARAYIERRAAALGWTAEEHVSVLTMLFEPPNPIRRKHHVPRAEPEAS